MPLKGSERAKLPLPRIVYGISRIDADTAHYKVRGEIAFHKTYYQDWRRDVYIYIYVYIYTHMYIYIYVDVDTYR